MIYNSLDIIPYKLFIKILETDDVTMLSDSETNIEVLKGIWDKLLEEHQNKNQTPESKRIFKLSKKVNEFIATHKVVVMACTSLRFEFNDDLYDIIIEKGFQLSTENTETYYSDLDRIERESNAYIIKAEYYQKMLPEPKESEETDYNIDDVIASHSAILGFDFGDYNTITYNKFFATAKQVDAKMKSVMNNNTKSNGK